MCAPPSLCDNHPARGRSVRAPRAPRETRPVRRGQGAPPPRQGRRRRRLAPLHPLSRMGKSMAKRDFLAVTDLSRDGVVHLFDLAHRMKTGAYRETPLAGKSLAMIFAKSSTRTRVSCEVGTYQLGGHALFLSYGDIQICRGEPIPDTARVLSRYVDGIMIRTFDHAEVEELARHATVPVINGLTDLSHPCQVLADLFTVREALGGWEGKRIAWVGAGNNMADSWSGAGKSRRR